jgi:hypothetical protein
MRSNAIRNTGEWEPIVDWLDHLAHDGFFRVPVFTTPPITRQPDGTLELRGAFSGEVLALCPVGDWIVFIGGVEVFRSMHFDIEPDDGR